MKLRLRLFFSGILWFVTDSQIYSLTTVPNASFGKCPNMTARMPYRVWGFRLGLLTMRDSWQPVWGLDPTKC